MEGSKTNPTPDQLEALRQYAEDHGRTWKAQLNRAWMTGPYGDNDHGNPLQCVRNQFGPSWLVRFSFKKYRSQIPVRRTLGIDNLQVDTRYQQWLRDHCGAKLLYVRYSGVDGSKTHGGSRVRQVAMDGD